MGNMCCFDEKNRKQNEQHLESFYSRIATFSEGVQVLKTILRQNKQDSGFISKEAWEFVLTKFQKYSLNFSEKMEFVNYISRIMQFDFETKSSDESSQFCEQISQKLHRLESSLFFNHKHCLQYLKYVSSNDVDQAFCKLKFNMSSEEIEEVASGVRVFCNNNLDAFSFLTLYLQKSLENLAADTDTEVLTKILVDKIKTLQKSYPASNIQLETNSRGLDLENIVFDQKYEILTFVENQKSHYDQLYDFIVQKAKMASEDLDLFKSIVKDICYEKGYGFKYGVKIKYQEKNPTAIFRVVQKLMDKNIYEKTFEKEKQKFQSEILKQSLSRSVKQKVKDQIKQVDKRIKRILQNQTSIQCDSKDLVRAKCIFSKIQDILFTVEQLKKSIVSKGCKLLQLKNRLGKNTKDVTLIIKLPNSIAQLQLALKLDSVSNQFNHKIYEIIRSNMYSPITSLFIHNKKWGQAFFSQQMEIFKNAIKIEPDRDYQEPVKFKDLQADVNQFQSAYLKKIFQTQKQQDQQQKDKQFFKKISQIIVNIGRQRKNMTSKERIQINQLKNDVRFYTSFHNYQLAQKFSKELLEQEMKVNPQSKEVATIYKNYGDLCKVQGEYEKAIELYLKSLTIRQNVLGKQNADTARIYNAIGTVYWPKGEFDKALEFYFKCLSIQQKVLGKQHLHTAGTYNNIALVYNDKREFEKSLEFYQKSLAVRQKILGKQNKDIADSYNNIGLTYKNKRDYEKALEFYQKSLAIRQKILGKQHIDITKSYGSLGQLQAIKGNYDGAIGYIQKSLNILQKVVGKQHITTSLYYSTLGLTYLNKFDTKKALEFFQKSLNIRLKILGEQSRETAGSYYDLGQLYDRQGDNQKALEFYKKSLSIMQKVSGEYIVINARINSKIGRRYLISQEYQKALEFFQKSLKIVSKILGKLDPITADNYIDVSVVYQKLNRIDDAYKSVETAYEIFTLKFGPQHIRTKRCQIRLKTLQKEVKK